jgi:hypothetical protein
VVATIGAKLTIGPLLLGGHFRAAAHTWLHAIHVDSTCRASVHQIRQMVPRVVERIVGRVGERVACARYHSIVTRAVGRPHRYDVPVGRELQRDMT